MLNTFGHSTTVIRKFLILFFSIKKVISSRWEYIYKSKFFIEKNIINNVEPISFEIFKDYGNILQENYQKIFCQDEAHPENLLKNHEILSTEGTTPVSSPQISTKTDFSLLLRNREISRKLCPRNTPVKNICEIDKEIGKQEKILKKLTSQNKRKISL